VALVVASTGALEVDFTRPLAIPPIAESRVDTTSTRVVDLDIRSGETRFLDGPATRTAGVNGAFLGPTLRARRGENVSFNVRNGLTEATLLHWHGMHVFTAMDGGPHQTVESDGIWTPKWMVDQAAATLWYHPHLHGTTADHAYQGVTGMFILDDDNSAGLNLPDTYGTDDIPMIVQDRTFDGDNQFDGSVPFLNNVGLDIVRFRAADRLADTTEVPAAMGIAPDVDTTALTEVRSFALAGRAINGATMDMNRIDFAVRKGTTQVWEVTNTNGYPHNFHVHDVQFQVLDVGADEPPPPLRGWKDTVLLVPDKRYRLAMRFSDYSDPNLPYMSHCHLLTHEDEGMMGQFVVLGDGEEIGSIPRSGHGHR